MEEGVAHSVLIISIVIAIGIMLGRIKIAGISLGITWILFTGIAFAHFGMGIDSHTLHFVKEFGLILFVYSVGLQVGPGFFSSFKKGGLSLNLLAAVIVFLGVITTYVIHVVTEIPITTMVGILSGAVTNTPGLGAAQQANFDMTGTTDPTIGMGYAVAYPLGVVGIIVTLISIKYLFRVKFDKETEDYNSKSPEKQSSAVPMTALITNDILDGKTIKEIAEIINRKIVFSRVYDSEGTIRIITCDTILHTGDKVIFVASQKDERHIISVLGEKTEVDWDSLDKQMISRRILITKESVNGKYLHQLRLRSNFDVNITRINRAGVDLVADPNLQLQIGDRVTVVGTKIAISNVEKILGNSLKRLNEPNLIPIFIGIFLGVLLGSIPFTFPGIPQPVKLGLAGGPLIVAILISRFGPKYKLVTYTTMSANLMLREIGIALFLATVGLSAGEGFVDTIVNQGGYKWIAYGAIITLLPIMIVGIFSRLALKMNYFTIMGLIAGSTTDPPALAYSNSTAGNDIPAVGYATVYPLTMFLRVLTAQMLILLG